MSVLTGFCKQTVTLQRLSGTSSRYPDEQTFDAARSIRVRLEPASGKKRTATGDEVEVESSGLTEEPIVVGDFVDGKEVVRVEEIVAKSGKRLGCEFYL